MKLLHRILEQVLWIDGIGSRRVQECFTVARQRLESHPQSSYQELHKFLSTFPKLLYKFLSILPKLLHDPDHV